MEILDNIKKYFKKVWNQFFYTSKQYSLYEKAKPGDIYYALMPYSRKKLATIPEGHKVRPYLIVGKDKHHLIGYQCGSNKPGFLKNYEYHRFRKVIYGHKKNSYFHLNKVYSIPIKNIYHKYTTIVDDDMCQIEKRLIISRSRQNYLPRFHIIIVMSIGDIFSLNHKKYYVYQKDSAHIYAHEVVKTKPDESHNPVQIRINHKKYYILTKTQKIFDANDSFQPFYILTPDEIYNVEKEKKIMKKVKQKEKKKKTVNIKFEYTIGQVLTNEFYESYIYLYSLNGRMYGIYSDLKLDEIPQIIRILNKENLMKEKILEKNEVLDIVNDLLFYNIDPHQMCNYLISYLDQSLQYMNEKRCLLIKGEGLPS